MYYVYMHHLCLSLILLQSLAPTFFRRSQKCGFPGSRQPTIKAEGCSQVWMIKPGPGPLQGATDGSVTGCQLNPSLSFLVKAAFLGRCVLLNSLLNVLKTVIFFSGPFWTHPGFFYFNVETHGLSHEQTWRPEPGYAMPSPYVLGLS